jgi:hypothetical protein
MRVTAAGRCLLLTVILAGLCFGQPQSLIIPHIADGGGWQTTLVLTNTSVSAGSASFTFYQETTGGATQRWNLPLVEAATQSVQVAGGATVFLHTPGTGVDTSVGWAQITIPASIVGYAIFTQRLPGRSDQDGTAPGGASAQRILVPFDNTAGFITAVSLVNPTAQGQTVTVNIQVETGEVSQSSIPLPAEGHTAFALSDKIPSTAGRRGLAEFYSLTTARGIIGSSLSMLALRFNPTGAFTTAPVYGQSGTPVVGVKPPPTTGGGK